MLTSDGQRFESDVTVWAGAFGVPSLAREAGIAVNRIGQIIVDPYLRSVSHPEIFAVGDAAATGLRMACATAMPIGAHAADNLTAVLRGNPLKPFRFGFGGRCISLGRHDGLIQMVNSDDSPREFIFTGRTAAFFKETICRYAYYSLPLERLIPGFYYLPRGSMPVPERALA